MAGSYHTLDRIAQEIAGALAVPADEQLRAIESQFSAYVERREETLRQARVWLDDARVRLEIANAANADLVRKLRAKRRKTTNTQPHGFIRQVKCACGIWLDRIDEAHDCSEGKSV